jgi:MoxR-like ATPase
VTEVHASDALRRYVVELAAATRNDARVELGASPRAGLLLFRAAKARAALEGRDHALPDDVQSLATPVLRHRLLLAPGCGNEERDAAIRDAVEQVPAL